MAEDKNPPPNPEQIDTPRVDLPDAPPENNSPPVQVPADGEQDGQQQPEGPGGGATPNP